jgi:SAM-dependent methyltransferase
LGWQTGFDSGQTLDYVYQNKAQGITPLGKMIDRSYLNAVGWQGIRQRGKNLEATLEKTIRRLLMNGEKAHVMDIAAGPGRYLLNILEKFKNSDVTALCRDWDEKGLQDGTQLAQQRGLSSVRYEKADAFSNESYQGLAVAPNIVVVSGLYELFDDNAMVQRSLQGIYNAMPDKGYLIYTNQPHHPQLELIARTLINRDHKPWLMRLRSQAEMHHLVRAVGFSPATTLIDEHGIFSVNVAVKRS